MNSNAESNLAELFTGKVLESWPVCDQFINAWGKSKGFNVIKDKVERDGDRIRRRIYICEHGKKYTSKSTKDTSSKKMVCPWHVNASCSSMNNPDSAIFINKIVDEHNHDLSIDMVIFGDAERFSNEIMSDIQFLTQHCKMGAAAQRRYGVSAGKRDQIDKKFFFEITSNLDQMNKFTSILLRNFF